MARRRRRRPNWPYRMAWLTIVGSLVLYIVVGTLVGVWTYGFRSYGIDWQIALVSTCFSATVAIWFTMVGASVGSFLNVVAYRLPLGRTIGGHSGCPYCCTPISKFDNIPVLAWLRLRGRCRTCRLPISAQYPLVEFLVAMVFLFVFLTEIRSGGNNLPHIGFQSAFASLGLSITLVLRMVSYFVIVSGLIASGLMVVKGKSPPLRLFAICGLPLLVSALVDPATILVPFRGVPQMADEPVSRVDAVLTFLLGLIAGGGMAVVLTPAVVAEDSPPADNEVEQVIQDYRFGRSIQTWIASLALAGAVLGWQAVVPLGWVIAWCWLLGGIIYARYRQRLQIADASAWVWLGLVIFRAAWQWLDRCILLPDQWPLVVRHSLGLLLLMLFCGVIARWHKRQYGDDPQLAT